jgi:hypothetical protein
MLEGEFRACSQLFRRMFDVAAAWREHSAPYRALLSLSANDVDTQFPNIREEPPLGYVR